MDPPIRYLIGALFEMTPTNVTRFFSNLKIRYVLCRFEIRYALGGDYIHIQLTRAVFTPSELN